MAINVRAPWLRGQAAGAQLKANRGAVLNISEDHMGLGGIHTLDQLAEVKATIVRITRAGGWVVLNADDPRTLAMRRLSRARPWRAGDYPSGRDREGSPARRARWA